MSARSAKARRAVLIRGSGSIGVRHARAANAAGHLAIIVPVRIARLSELAAEGFTTATTVAEAVELGASAAIVATDTGRHVDDIVEALEAGCSVLCEKPLAPALASVTGRVDAAWRSRVFVAYCLRFHEGIAAFRKHLNLIGVLHSVRIECQSYLPGWRAGRAYQESYSARADEGGVLRDLSHEIDYASWLFGAPRALTARLDAGSRLGIEAETAADLLWRTPSDVTVSLRLDYLTRKTRRVMTARGTHGEVTWDASAGTVTVETDEADAVVHAIPHDRDSMMRRQVEAFLIGEAPELCRLEEGLVVLAMCDAARRSDAERREIRVQESG